MEKIKLEKQEILVGSSRLSDSNRKSFDRVKYFLENMEFNKSYIYKIKNNPNNKDIILEELKKHILLHCWPWCPVHRVLG